MAERKFGDNGFANGKRVTESMTTGFDNALSVGKPKRTVRRLRKLRSALNRRSRQLETLAAKFPVYFYHPSLKAKEHAEDSHNSRSVFNIIKTESIDGEIHWSRPEVVEQRERLSAGAEAVKSSSRTSGFKEKRQKATKETKGN